MAGVTFTKHARQRMEERRVSVRDVVRALALGEAVPTRRPAVYRTRIPRIDESSESEQTETVGSVVVVYQEGGEHAQFTVITVWSIE